MGKSPRAHPQGSEVGEGHQGQEVLKGRPDGWDPMAVGLGEVVDPRRGCGVRVPFDAGLQEVDPRRGCDVRVPYGEGDLRGELEGTQDCRRRRKDAERP